MRTVTIHDLEKYAAEDEQKKKINTNRTLLARAEALNLEAKIQNWNREALEEQLILGLGFKSAYANYPIQNIKPVVIEKAKEGLENGLFKFTNEAFDEFVNLVLSNITHQGAHNAWQQTLTTIGAQGFQKSLNRASNIMTQGPVQFNIVLNSSSSASPQPVSSTALDESVPDNKESLLSSSDSTDITHTSSDSEADSEALLEETDATQSDNADSQAVSTDKSATTEFTSSKQNVQVIDIVFDTSDNLDFHFYKGLKNLINQTINGNGFAALGLLVMYDQRDELLSNFTQFAGKENLKQPDYYRSTTEFVSSCSGAMVKRFSQADLKSIYRNLSQCSLVVKDTSQRQNKSSRSILNEVYLTKPRSTK